MKGFWKAGIVLVFVQALLLAAYFHFRDSKPVGPGEAGRPSVAAPSTVKVKLPKLETRDRNGVRQALSVGLEPRLIHIWATWCPPCRAELPGLLALDGEGVNVVAIALDPSWNAMEKFFNSEVPPQVVLGDADQVQSVLGITTLPVTFLANRGERLYLRFDGARDWTSKSFRQDWLESP